MVRSYRTVPFPLGQHRVGFNAPYLCDALGQFFDGSAMSELTDNEQTQAVEIFASFDLEVTIGG